MKHSTDVFRLGLSFMFGTLFFSLFLWNYFINHYAHSVLIQELGQPMTSSLLIFVYFMPLFIGLPIGFFFIFKSIKMENEECAVQIAEIRQQHEQETKEYNERIEALRLNFYNKS